MQAKFVEESHTEVESVVNRSTAAFVLPGSRIVMALLHQERMNICAESAHC